MDGARELTPAPLRIVALLLHRIADRDPLHVRVREEVQHDAQALGADADESDVDSLARWGIRRSAEYASGHDGERGGGSGSLQELAPRQRIGAHFPISLT